MVVVMVWRRDNRNDCIATRHASRITKLLWLIAVSVLLPVTALAQPAAVPQAGQPKPAAVLSQDAVIPPPPPIAEQAKPLQTDEATQSIPEEDSMQEPPDEGGDEGTVTPKNVQVPEVKPEAPKSAEAPPAGKEYNGVILRGLNKVTARAQTIDAPIGSVVRFGTIEIVAHRCWEADPEERPEDAALIEISEIKQGEAPARIFLGWMFASSPTLSSLEHPFYDVTVVKCTKAAKEDEKD